ncbi:MAG: hypothetical protein C3F12_12235 [Candidatus Methylomirabilota bacterium]|nr:hypothetical protein [candidate division NC10 bacterium]PWB43999.1 MAG: hypothetical protein C3F12_12235 [candidate division NC10 bacterium]
MDRVAVLGEQRATVDMAVAAFECQGVEVGRIVAFADMTTTLPDTPYLLAVLCLTKAESAELGSLRRLITDCPDIPIVPAVCGPSLETALAAIRLGAFDLLTVPFVEEAIETLLGRARHHRLETMLRGFEVLFQHSSWFAHEVRNPLAGILNSAQLLREESARSPSVQRRLRVIIEEGQRMEQFLRRMTELGTPGRGMVAPASLSAVAERALARAEPQLRRQGIRLEREFDPGEPETRINAPHMELAVSRVIANAAAAMPTGGVMAVRTRHRPDEQMVDLEVTDTDCQTGPERERQLAGRFESSRLREAGLGLVAALRTFVAHGGDMSFRIRSGRGCSIIVRLPVDGHSGRA